jgi:hypothetical protein
VDLQRSPPFFPSGRVVFNPVRKVFHSHFLFQSSTLWRRQVVFSLSRFSLWLSLRLIGGRIASRKVQPLEAECVVTLNHVPVTRIVIPSPFPREDPRVISSQKISSGFSRLNWSSELLCYTCSQHAFTYELFTTRALTQVPLFTLCSPLKSMRGCNARAYLSRHTMFTWHFNARFRNAKGLTNRSCIA